MIVSAATTIRLNDVSTPDHVIVDHHETIREGSPSGGEVRLGVAISVGSFSGSYDQVWIDRDAWRSFIGSLCQLESTRSGVATLRAMSPDEFELRFRVADAAGHVAVDGFLGRPHWHRFASAYTTRIAFCIELDPSLLRDLAGRFKAFGRAGA